MFLSMNKSTGALFALLAATTMLAACNGTNNGFPGPGPTSTPSGNCGGPPSGNQLEVVYPIPGSKNAPPNLPYIYVATKGQLPPSNQFDFYLLQSNGQSTFTGIFASTTSSGIPKPHATPKYSNPSYYATYVGGPYGSPWTIGNDQSVTLLWNDGGRNCSPHFLVASFRTKKV
jgi:hypothetical protein